VSGDDAKNFQRLIAPDAENWVTFENTFEGVSHDDVTIAWFYPPDIGADETKDSPGAGLHISETRQYHQIKMGNVQHITFRGGKIYHFSYVIFPYRYDEQVATKYGVLSVRDTIRKLRDEFGTKPSP